MAHTLLMPKATAIWLVDNTALTFEQISNFCNLHLLEIKAIADGDSAQGIKGQSPISNGQLTREELKTAEANPNHKLQLAKAKVLVPELKRKGPRYTPVSKRQDRPNAILWLLKNHAELRNAQIIKLIGTTKNTIEAIRDRSHWNSANLVPLDPVTLGLCTQIDLDFEVKKSAKYRVEPQAVEGAGLLPTDETQNTDVNNPFADTYSAPEPKEESVDADSVFANFNSLNTSGDNDASE
jgi:hypothetical protein